MTQNDVGGEWIEMTPPTPSTTVTLTRAKSLELTSEGTLAIAMSIIGVIGLIVVVYLLTRKS